MCFLVLYTIEFVLKLYCAPLGYWKSNFNKFDFIILGTSFLQFAEGSIGSLTFLRVLRALRALRAFRAIGFLRPFQIIASSMVKTVVSIVNLIAILFLLLYVFGVIGYYMLGEQDPAHWADLAQAILSMHIYVTADGWTAILQHPLDEWNRATRIFSIICIFFCNIIFTNLFIGVVLQNLSQARQEAEALDMAKKKKQVDKKKQLYLSRQKLEWTSIIDAQKERGTRNVQGLLASMAGRLRHDDIVPCTLLACNTTWMQAYTAVLQHQENNMYRVQQLQFELAESLATIVERRLATRTMR
ncbi:putative cation channel sperm-associated protein 3 [Paratrimastix pyriformis]|uniref:Cation channel sperm-associated protein 3 n=1 Tax=Paratrimastix pyriformis TaxID=342808 RepID=A0ABQ8UAM7_9EUKA|nr:putative cation channel sperm-associated protein 3 [Paratrimastix pyriformis]